MRFFDPETGQERFGPTKHDGKVLALAVHPNGEVVASAGAGPIKASACGTWPRGSFAAPCRPNQLASPGSGLGLC